jgi:hypothetical protein
MGTILAVLPILILFALGFASGYGVREWISWRRRAAERENSIESIQNYVHNFEKFEPTERSNLYSCPTASFIFNDDMDGSSSIIARRVLSNRIKCIGTVGQRRAVPFDFIR